MEITLDKTAIDMLHLGLSYVSKHINDQKTALFNKDLNKIIDPIVEQHLKDLLLSCSNISKTLETLRSEPLPVILETK